MALWFMTAAALAAALVAWVIARRTARRVSELSEMYWELKYQHGELRAQLLQSHGPRGTGTDAAASPAAQARPPDVFVPLASLKR